MAVDESSSVTILTYRFIKRNKESGEILPNEFGEMTDEEIKNAEVGTIVAIACRNCEGHERHQRQENGKWKCLWCDHEEVEF